MKKRVTQWRARVIAVIVVVSMLAGNFYGVNIVQAGVTQVEYYEEYEGDGYLVMLRGQSVREDGFEATIEIKNTGKEKLKNWEVELALSEGKLKNVWNAQGSRQKNNYLFSCEEHNYVIYPGSSIAFGCQIEGASWEAVAGAVVRQNPRQTAKKGTYEITYRIASQWGNYASIEAEIYNRSTVSIRDWGVTFKFSGTITSIWNADIVSEKDGTWYIENKEYNVDIGVGSSVKFGFEAEFADENIICPEEGILACTIGEKEPSVTPQATVTPVPTLLPSDEPSLVPVQTETPDKPQPDTGTAEEDFDPEKDAWVYHDIENRDWNMEMIHADSAVVKEELAKPRDGIRVALLDSGINYSDEVYVSMRKNFVPGQDDYSELYEDVSGHGTAVAEVLASNPNGTPVVIDAYGEEDSGEYTYYDEAGNVISPETDEEEGEEPQIEGSLLEVLESGYEWNEGVNPTIDLISAKVLDENNETTVERVSAAIDWAIENDADIISMSFGMEKPSAELRRAVQKAYDAGLLIIAAAGNDNKVEYPAAYPEVMAVGSVDSMAEQAEQSAEGKEIEVVAPGEFIVSRGAFDSMQIFSGTSMAVPHVVGLASILWQKDTSKSADFVRQLIDTTARECGPSSECGYGLIDCEYALEKYNEFAAQYKGGQKEIADGGSLAVSMENPEEIDTDEGVRSLYGSWGGKEHEGFLSSNAETYGKLKKIKGYITLLKRAVTFVDGEKENPKCQGMHFHPWFHGFFGKNGTHDGKKTVSSNYVASYHYLYTLAEKMYSTGKVKLADTDTSEFKDKDNTELRNAYQGINKAFKDENKVGSQTWNEIHPECGVKKDGSIPKKERSLILFGMALHTLTDTYAHSSFSWGGTKKKKIVWKRITHSKKAKDGVKRADSTQYIERRSRDAKRVAKACMAKLKLENKEFKGFEPGETSVSVYLSQKDYKGILNSREYIKLNALRNAYALQSPYKYAMQLNGFGDVDGKTIGTVEKKLKNISVKTLREKTESYKYYKAKRKVFKNPEKKKKKEYIVEDEKTGEKLVKADIETETGTVEIVASNASDVVMNEVYEGTSRLCCKFSKGKVLNAVGQEIPESEDESDDDSVTEEDDLDEEEMCDVYCFEFDKLDVQYRIVMTWDDGTMDMDALLAGLFPDRDEFYLTCCVEKTSHPELADVFQKDTSRASLDQDITDASGAETITIHNVEEGGIYMFGVRNYIEDYEDGTELQIARSGATIKVYRGYEVEPVYTATVPEGKGYYWNAFYLFGDTGTILPIDSVTDEWME